MLKMKMPEQQVVRHLMMFGSQRGSSTTVLGEVEARELLGLPPVSAVAPSTADAASEADGATDLEHGIAASQQKAGMEEVGASPLPIEQDAHRYTRVYRGEDTYAAEPVSAGVGVDAGAGAGAGAPIWPLSGGLPNQREPWHDSGGGGGVGVGVGMDRFDPSMLAAQMQQQQHQSPRQHQLEHQHQQHQHQQLLQEQQHQPQPFQHQHQQPQHLYEQHQPQHQQPQQQPQHQQQQQQPVEWDAPPIQTTNSSSGELSISPGTQPPPYDDAPLVLPTSATASSSASVHANGDGLEGGAATPALPTPGTASNRNPTISVGGINGANGATGDNGAGNSAGDGSDGWGREGNSAGMISTGGTVPVFRQDLALEDASCFHACSFEALSCV
jgi:hypothetical protein